MRELIEDFVSRLPGICTELGDALAANDVARLRRVAHQMTGAGAGYGFPELSQAGAGLERAIVSEGSITPAVALLGADLQDLCQRVRAGLPS